MSVEQKQSIYEYGRAFSRTIGWLTREELYSLRNKRVAIAGLGGVGGQHLLTLARLGIGAFAISDFDHFSIENINRQAGAMTSTLGKPKIEVLSEMANDINPELDIRMFPAGVNAGNIDEFLYGVDLYVDGLDFFAIDARRMVFDACAEKKIPIVTSAPLGMGVATIAYKPGAMPLSRYFGLVDGDCVEDQLIRFLIGLSPALLQRSYLADNSTVNFTEKKGPSTPMACELCAGVAATVALKLLLGRGRVMAAPWGSQYDPYLNRFVRTWRPGGYKNPLQRVGFMLVKRHMQLHRGGSSR